MGLLVLGRSQKPIARRRQAVRPQLLASGFWLLASGSPLLPQNQKAHEVTRDVTAWAWAAGLPFGRPLSGGSFDAHPFWHRTDSSATCSRAWARLGPLSRGDACDRGPSTDGFVATVSAATAHPTGWHGGIPTGRPWDFALRTCVPPKGLGSSREGPLRLGREPGL